MRAPDFLDRLKNIRRSGKGWTARCPAHEDRANSLSVAEGDDGRILVKCFAGCGAEDIVQSLGLTMSDLFPDTIRLSPQRGGVTPPATPATLQHPLSPAPCTLSEYAESKGLPQSFLKEQGLQDQKHQEQPRIRIPYLDAHRQELAVRYRIALVKSEHGDNRFLWKKGSKLHLYGLWLLDQAQKTSHVVLVEGESDCHALWFHKIPALGLPGANTWREEWSRHLEGFDTIYVVIEPDKGGATILKWLAESAIRDRVRLIIDLSAPDVSDLYLADRARFPAAFQTALDSAVPWHQWHSQQMDARTQEAREQCEDLVRSSDILDRFYSDLKDHGVAGEERAAKLLFLILNTRWLDRPVSAVLKAQSASGKNYLMERVLDFFPSESYHLLTAMSERALAYSDAPLQHKFLVIAEAVGAQGDFLSYLIRSLLSEGRLRYETVEKTAEGLKARVIEKEGPTGLLMTTTAISLHPENETRYFSLPLSDTPSQTRDILLKQAVQTNRDSGAGIDLIRWRALQTWLDGSQHQVFIPYAQTLAELIPAKAVRLRRDFPAILRLIKAHTIVHQANRELDAKGRLVATPDDYATVRDLVKDLLGEAVDATVSPTIRDTVGAVRQAAQGGGNQAGSSNAAVAKLLGVEKSTSSRRLRSAAARGYIKNLETKKGRPAQWVMGDPLPDDIEVLPAPVLLGGEGCISPATVERTETNRVTGGCCSVAGVAEGVHHTSQTDDPEREVFRFRP